ncbi:MAG: glycosyltransferase [Candidatus Omnitrophica bacterium]|nr:glycosyltransferase [Candidatus Omnitrophota bacterium]
MRSYDTKLSIVIPAYNCAETITHTMGSVCVAEALSMEIILINDGSSDDTAKKIRSVQEMYEKKIKYIQQDNAGPGAARNAGILASQGAYIAFLDADDLLMPDSLIDRVRFLDENPDVDLVFSDYAVQSDTSQDTDSVLEKKRLLSVLGKETHEQRNTGVVFNDQFYKKYLDFVPYPIWTGTVMMRRAVVEKTGLFRTDVYVGEDRDYWMRVLENHRVGYLPRVTAIYHIHAAGITQEKIRYHRNRIKTFKPLLVGRRIDLRKVKKIIGSEYFFLAYEHYRQNQYLVAKKSFLQSFRYRPHWRSLLYLFLPPRRWCTTIFSTKSKVKTVLCVSYFFPPCANTGAIRPAKFVKYLSAYGWKPVVLTCERFYDFGSGTNLELCGDIPPSTRVYRTSDIFSWKRRRVKPRAGATGKNGGITKRVTWYSRMKHFYRDLRSVPDVVQGWIVPAVLTGLRICRRHRVAAVFATTPFPSSLVAGYVIARIRRLPLIVDYRNPWNSSYWARKHFSFFQALTRRLEKMILEYAARMVVVSRALKQDIVRSYPAIAPGKITVIPNGYDLDNVPSHEGLFPKFTLVHAGHLYHEEDSREFLEVVNELCREDPEFQRSVQLVFLGAKPQSEVFTALEVRGIARHRKRVPRGECLTILARAHAALVFFRKSREMPGLMTPSKIFDAMLCRKPILGQMSEGEEQEVVRASGLGKVAGYGEKTTVKKSILDAFAAFRQGTVLDGAREGYIRQYERRVLTGRLAEVLCQAVKGERT